MKWDIISFPMIVNSDERQWSWMDEGLNTFLEKETMRVRYPELSRNARNTKRNCSFYERRQKSDASDHVDRPITSVKLNLDANAYTKPSAALTVLRETVMGPELFDKAFKEYAQRWAFKHPKPADFFRTMEDASAVDLDWFWRGWFYTNDNVDVNLEEVNGSSFGPKKSIRRKKE